MPSREVKALLRTPSSRCQMMDFMCVCVPACLPAACLPVCVFACNTERAWRDRKTKVKVAGNLKGTSLPTLKSDSPAAASRVRGVGSRENAAVRVRASRMSILCLQPHTWAQNPSIRLRAGVASLRDL